MNPSSNAYTEGLSAGTNRNRRSRASQMTRIAVQSYLMLSPQLLGFLVFTIYPVFWVLRWAWYDYDSVQATFIGFGNFERIFMRDERYWQSLLNTVVLAFGKLTVEIPLALLLAVLLNGKVRGRNLFRTVFFMPNIVSVAVIGLLFYFLFATFEGIVNNVLLDLRAISESVNWFGGKWTSMFVIATASVWENFGINMLFFLAGLQSVPKDLYEAAEIDGASRVQQFTRITLPMLAPVIQVVLMLAIIGSLKVTDLVLVLTNGQPGGSTEVVMTYIFKYFFRYGEGPEALQIGYAASMGLVTAVLIGLITAAYFWMTRRMSKIY
ncbi:carbohydrate ABC transporter permease [Cohnella phaseoli]|uniref:Raffinose/stachyose/melibiose transport system permease protein n=1 Tax=Cohnella phaseoli TaxID=456490 RepID=A0A3D9JUZ3_9BACL|nr:sugar ABC transporter permease [Cohnella phaseoli]RED77589.1 raffinose/stachyose/melibiose transport system permease protein [Cohnella phaseoli]